MNHIEAAKQMAAQLQEKLNAQQAKIKTYHVSKGGRCWNGAHRDSGKLIHAVICEDRFAARISGPFFNKSVCGTTPGRTSYGWVEEEGEVSCPKCLKKMKP